MTLRTGAYRKYADTEQPKGMSKRFRLQVEMLKAVMEDLMQNDRKGESTMSDEEYLSPASYEPTTRESETSEDKEYLSPDSYEPTARESETSEDKEYLSPDSFKPTARESETGEEKEYLSPESFKPTVAKSAEKGNTLSLLSAGTLKGTEVVNRKGESLGELEEIMLDLATGRVTYAVLSFGGILGVGDKLFAIPWQAFEVDQKRERIILNKDKESLEDAPGFDKNRWPQIASTDWLGEVYRYYGYSYS